MKKIALTLTLCLLTLTSFAAIHQCPLNAKEAKAGGWWYATDTAKCTIYQFKEAVIPTNSLIGCYYQSGLILMKMVSAKTAGSGDWQEGPGGAGKHCTTSRETCLFNY